MRIEKQLIRLIHNVEHERMVGTVKKLRSDLFTLRNMLYGANHLKESMLLFSDEEQHKQMIDYLKNMITALEDHINSLPIGHKYTGTFYIKRSYSVPLTSIKVEGEAFMREELVSWSLETDDEAIQCYGYVRDIYKDKELLQMIKREDAVAVFPKLVEGTDR